MILFLLLVTAPLLAFGAAAAWQDYLVDCDQPIGQLETIRQVAAVSGRTAVASLRDMMDMIARSPFAIGGDPAACSSDLAGLLGSLPNDAAALEVVDPQGAIRCAMPAPPITTDPGDRSAIRSALQTGRFTIAITPAALLAVDPILSEGRNLGAVTATLAPAWFAGRLLPAGRGLAAWLVDWQSGGQSDGQSGWLPIFGDAAALQPPADVRRRLAAGDVAAGSARSGGRPITVGSIALTQGMSPDVHLVVAGDTSGAIGAAQARLRRRIELLFGFLAGAIGLTMICADRVIVAPVRRVGVAVRDWRRGAAFEVEGVDRLPAELRGLAESFAAAVDRLSGREAELRRAVAQQDLAMQEVHHRVKNNLQIVASLLNLQANRIRQPEARAEFQSARDRVRALATLHRHLYVQGEIHTIEMRAFLVELCEQLFQAMGEVEGQRISLDISASALQMVSDQAVPLALIVTEAVGNALKYAFPGNRAGHLTVSLEGTEDTARLIVQDDGVGIPAGPAETETGRRDGLGIQLIRGFAQQLGAALTVDQGTGTRYVVEMPLKRQRDAEDAA